MCEFVLPLTLGLLWGIGAFYEVRSRRFPNPAVPEARGRMWTRRRIPLEDLSPEGVHYHQHARRPIRIMLVAGLVYWLAC